MSRWFSVRLTPVGEELFAELLRRRIELVVWLLLVGDSSRIAGFGSWEGVRWRSKAFGSVRRRSKDFWWYRHFFCHNSANSEVEVVVVVSITIKKQSTNFVESQTHLDPHNKPASPLPTHNTPTPTQNTHCDRKLHTYRNLLTTRVILAALQNKFVRCSWALTLQLIFTAMITRFFPWLLPRVMINDEWQASMVQPFETKHVKQIHFFAIIFFAVAWSLLEIK